IRLVSKPESLNARLLTLFNIVLLSSDFIYYLPLFSLFNFSSQHFILLSHLQWQLYLVTNNFVPQLRQLLRQLIKPFYEKVITRSRYLIIHGPIACPVSYGWRSSKRRAATGHEHRPRVW